MSNSWQYTLVLPAPGRVSADQVRHILQIAEEHGYSGVNPFTGLFSGVVTDGMDSFEFNDLDSTIEFLSNSGGYLEIWKWNRHNDFGLGIFPSGSTAVDAIGSMHIYASNSCFRYEDDTQESLEAAEDAQGLFADLCVLLDPPYGFSTDEYILEALLNHLGLSFPEYLHIRDAAQGDRPPALLYWLQYFSHDYAAQLDLKLLSTLRGTVVPQPKGIIVSFFDYPWNVGASMLAMVNDAWRKSGEK